MAVKTGILNEKSCIWGFILQNMLRQFVSRSSTVYSDS